MHPFLCPFQHEQKIKELEAEIQELEAELQYTKFLLDQEKAAFQALERKVEKHLGCRYKGDAAQKCKVAATALARSDAAKADIAHMKSKTRYRAVQRWEEKYGEQWNSVLRQKIREADRIKVTNEQLKKEAKQHNYQLTCLQDKVRITQLRVTFEAHMIICL